MFQTALSYNQETRAVLSRLSGANVVASASAITRLNNRITDLKKAGLLPEFGFMPEFNVSTTKLVNIFNPVAGQDITISGTGATASAITDNTDKYLQGAIKLTKTSSQKLTSNFTLGSEFTLCGWAQNITNSLNSIVAGDTLGGPQVVIDTTTGATAGFKYRKSAATYIDIIPNQTLIMNNTINWFIWSQKANGDYVIMMNGKVITGNTTEVFTPGKLIIGANQAGTSDYHNGQIVSVHAYNRALTQSDCYKLFNLHAKWHLASWAVYPAVPSKFNGNLKVFLLRGQSNCVGEGEMYFLDAVGLADRDFPEVPFYNRIASPKVVANMKVGPTAPINVNGNVPHVTFGNTFGFEVTFANRLAFHFGKVGIVKTGANATALVNDVWEPPSASAVGTWFTNAKNDYNDAMTKFPTISGVTSVSTIGLVWMQGEQDAGRSVTKDNYKAGWMRMYNQTCIDTGNPNLIAIICGMHYNLNVQTAAYEAIRQAGIELAAENPYVSYIETFDLHKHSGLHFSALGQLAMGSKAADQIINDFYT